MYPDKWSAPSRPKPSEAIGLRARKIKKRTVEENGTDSIGEHPADSNLLLARMNGEVGNGAGREGIREDGIICESTFKADQTQSKKQSSFSTLAYQKANYTQVTTWFTLRVHARGEDTR